MENWRLEAIKKNLERITRQQKWDQQINELMKAIEALPVWVGHTKEFEEQNIRLNQKRDVEACEYLNSHPQVVTDGCNDRSCVKENVALTHFDEEFVQEDPKELSYAQEKVKEDVGLGAGLEAVEKKLEKDGTYSSREQGEADWQLASETDLQDFHYTIFEHKWAGIQGLGSNYKRSGLEFYSIMIFGLQLEQHVLYGPLFEQRMIWDPGIRVDPSKVAIKSCNMEDMEEQKEEFTTSDKTSDGFTEVKRKKNKALANPTTQVAPSRSGTDLVTKGQVGANSSIHKANVPSTSNSFDLLKNVDVGDECGVSSSMGNHEEEQAVGHATASKHTSSSWNEDFESNDEVDEVIFPEGNKFGDQFDIRLKGRVRK
ncbi:hypothetical protein Tco_0916576 [Tanacetum coccineum]